MKRHFLPLKSRMVQFQYTQEQMAKRIGRSPDYLNMRMNGRAPFNMKDIETMGKILRIPKTEWMDYFYEGDAV